MGNTNEQQSGTYIIPEGTWIGGSLSANIEPSNIYSHYAGKYCLRNSCYYCIFLTEKPNWLRRAMMLWLFGFEWQDLNG
jgi:hypothetical protein